MKLIPCPLKRDLFRRRYGFLAAVMTAAFIVIVAGGFPGVARAVGYWQNPVPRPENLYDVDFPDVDNGWAVGANGAIIATKDGGHTWAPQTPPAGIADSSFWAVSFADENHGWASSASTIIATVNGGKTWQEQALPADPAWDYCEIGDVSFSDPDHGWAIGVGHMRLPYSTTSTQFLLATDNGGTSWHYAHLDSPLGSCKKVMSVKGDPDHVWLFEHGGGLVASDDGGTTWSTLNAPPPPRPDSPVSYAQVHDVCFTDAQHGWAVGQALTSTGGDQGVVIYATTDGGASWNMQYLENAPNWWDRGIADRIYFAPDGQHGWATGRYQMFGILSLWMDVWETVDGGANWTWSTLPQTRDSGLAQAARASFPDASHGMVVGGNMTLAYGPDPRPTTHTITASAGPGGSISPSGALTLGDGDSITFTVTPDAGYRAVDVVVDGASQGSKTTYAFSNVYSDHTISAAFNAIDPGDWHPATATPVLVLIAGLDSDTGGIDSNAEPYRGAPWDYLGDDSNAQLKSILGVSKILVAPTQPVESIWRDTINSNGDLDSGIDALIFWLREQDKAGEFDGHRIILVGHSYGGVIARSMVAAGSGRGFGPSDSVRKKIIGLVQFGSPNGGSRAAESLNGEHNDALAGGYRIYKEISGHGASDATRQLAESVMKQWNADHLTSVGVPVARLGGTYLPYALTVYTNPAGLINIELNSMDKVMDHKPSDGLVSWDSLRNGNDSLTNSTRDFGDGMTLPLQGLAHAAGIPGEWEQIVPQDAHGTLMGWLVKAIQGMKSRAGLTLVAHAARREVAASESAPSGQVCNEVPAHVVSVSAGSTAHVMLPVDAAASISVTSPDGTPTVVVRGPDGAALPCPSISTTTSDGAITMLSVTPTTPGSHTFDITLPAGVSGTATLSGLISGGAQFALANDPTPYAGSPVSVTASFTAVGGSALTGASVAGTAYLGGQPDIAMTFRDDGTAGDDAASDGIYTARFTPSAAGRWSADVEGACPTAERAGTIVFDVGEQLASVTGPLSETTTPGPGSTLASFGVTVPLHVSAVGTYTVGGDLIDASGAQVGVVTATADLAADETTTLTAAIDASQLSGIATGELTVSPLRITHHTDGIDLAAGSGPGLTTARSYAATDFYAFSVSLDGPDLNPSPTKAVHFAGTALNTASTVASVEYTIDGGLTWQPAAATDGAFDSHVEGFTIDLDLPDYVYGILVRQTGADGTALPVADWAGIRFRVDTVAPAQVADLNALVTTDGGSSVARASWLPSEPPSDIASPVSYEVTLDAVAAGTTWDANMDVALPDAGLHTLTVTPVDAAGNLGPASSTSVGKAPDTTPPFTVATGADALWHNAAVTVTLTPTDDIGGSGMTGGLATTEYKIDAAASWSTGTAVIVGAPANHSGDGVRAISYRSTDAAGNVEATKSVTVKIDTTSPAGSFTLAAGAATTTTTAVAGTSAVSEANGPLEMRFSLDGKASWSSWEAYAASKALTLPGTFGAKTVYAQYRDAAGNVLELSDAIELVAPPDATAPTTVATGADALWHNAAVTVTLTPTDDIGGSGMAGGLATTEYRIDAVVSWSTGTEVIVGAPANHSGDGVRAISYRSTDAAGNVEATKSVTVKIDTTSPAGSFTLAAGAATTTTTAVAGTSAVSEANGPLEMRFSLDGKASWSSWEAYAASKALTLPGSLGAKTVYAQYRDAAGNVLELSDAIELVAPPDATAPTVESSGASEGSWYRVARLVTLTASDSGSGVASITYTLDGIETTVPGAFALVSVPASPNRLHALTYYATDASTNSCASKTLTFTTDTTGPVTAAQYASGRRGHAITLRYKITDALSPRATAIRIVVKNRRGITVKTFRPTSKATATWYRVKWTPKARGTFRYYVYAKDLAGNVQRIKGNAKVVVR